MLAHFNNENPSFEKYASKFNSLEKRGKNKILPLLLKHFLQKNPEGGWNFVLKLSNQDLTETQKRIIDSHNMVEKIAYYFLMMDIDYEFVLSETDDETMTQFILCDYSS